MRASRKYHRPWLQPATTPEAYAELLSRAQDDRYEPMLVCRRDDGAIVGFFNVSQIVRGPFQSAFLGYGAVAAYAGQGYMSEGLQLVLARVFAELRLHRLEANIQPGNTASIELVRRARIRARGIRRAISQDRWTLARPRALGDPSRAVGEHRRRRRA